MAIPKILRVNMKLLPVKATYFFQLGAVASLLPYLNVYMNNIGLNYSEMSIIYGTSPFVSAILRPLVGILADKFQKHKLLLMICCILSGLFHGLLLMTPKAELGQYALCKAPVEFNCRGGIQSPSWVEICNHGNQTNTNKICVSGDNCTSHVNYFSNASMCTMTCQIDSSLCYRNTNTSFFLEACQDQPKYNNTEITFSQSRLQSDNMQYTEGKSDNMCQSYLFENMQYEQHAVGSISCPKDFNVKISSCSMTCESVTPKRPLTTCPSFDIESEKVKPYQRTFWFFFLIYMIAQVFFSPIFSLVDAMVYDYLGADAGKWGHQRLWGTVGFSIFAVISGLMMDVFTDLDLELEAGSNFTFAFVAFAILSILGGLVVVFYRISSNIKSSSMFKNLGKLFTSFEVIVLLVCTFLYGAYTGIIETFLYVRLQELNAPKVLMGLCMLINCFPEIFILIFAGVIIKRIGYFASMCVVFGAYIIRLVGYAFLVKPWLVLLIEPLHSISFGLMYAAVSSYGNDVTPEGMHATIQSVIGALYFGFGKGIGSIVSGQIYGPYGARATFLGFGMSGVVFLIIYIVIYYSALRKRIKLRESPKKVVEIDTKEAEMKMLNSADNVHEGTAEKVPKEETEPLNCEDTEGVTDNGVAHDTENHQPQAV